MRSADDCLPFLRVRTSEERVSSYLKDVRRSPRVEMPPWQQAVFSGSDPLRYDLPPTKPPKTQNKCSLPPGKKSLAFGLPGFRCFVASRACIHFGLAASHLLTARYRGSRGVVDGAEGCVVVYTMAVPGLRYCCSCHGVAGCRISSRLLNLTRV